MTKELFCTGILAINLAGLFLTMNGMESLKGIICLIGIYTAELTIIAICYRQGIAYNAQTFALCSELREICGLGTAMMQFFFNLIWEMKRVNGRFQKTLMIMGEAEKESEEAPAYDPAFAANLQHMNQFYHTAKRLQSKQERTPMIH